MSQDQYDVMDVIPSAVDESSLVIKKKRVLKRKLQASDLRNEKTGLRLVYNSFRSFRRTPGKEAEDIDRLLSNYGDWVKRMLPGLSLGEFLHEINNSTHSDVKKKALSDVFSDMRREEYERKYPVPQKHTEVQWDTVIEQAKPSNEEVIHRKKEAAILRRKELMIQVQQQAQVSSEEHAIAADAKASQADESSADHSITEQAGFLKSKRRAILDSDEEDELEINETQPTQIVP